MRLNNPKYTEFPKFLRIAQNWTSGFQCICSHVCSEYIFNRWFSLGSLGELVNLIVKTLGEYPLYAQE